MAGRGRELKGSLKETAGKALSNESLQAGGKAQRLKVKLQRAG